jgi:hypothetical protein
VTRCPLVYVAHPVTTYSTDHARDALKRLGLHLPCAELIDPAARYADLADWLADWPRLVATIDALVLFTEPSGTVGAGCLRELAESWGWGLPVALFDDTGLREVRSVRVLPQGQRTPARTAVVAGGWPVEPDAFLAPRRASRGDAA